MGENRLMRETPACPNCRTDHPGVLTGDVCPVCGRPLPPDRAMRLRPTTILWIDDDQLLLRLCEQAFEQYGYQVLPASDGPTGIALAKRERPDLILLDVMMLDMNGLEVCARLRAEPALADTPIVLLTVLEDAAVRDQGRAVGATAMWPKSCGPEELLAKVAQLLGDRRRRATR
jgi:CheY-like chemotaxis protein